MSSDRITKISWIRSSLKRSRDFLEAIPLQRELVLWWKEHGRVEDYANAWNYLAGLYLNSGLYDDAEYAADQAISVYDDEPSPSAEILACYQMVSARIYAAQSRFEEAIAMGEESLRNYGFFHNPPDEFLLRMQDQVETFRKQLASEFEQGLRVTN